MKKKLFKWFNKYCGYCLAGDTKGSAICACCEDGSFETTKHMPECKEENCIPLKNLPKEFR